MELRGDLEEVRGVSFTYSPPPVVIDASVAIEMIAGSHEWQSAFDSWSAADRLLLAAGVETTDRGRAGLFAALSLSEARRLTVYDALYLQLALDVEGELATLDRALRAAAEAEGVALVP